MSGDSKTLAEEMFRNSETRCEICARGDDASCPEVQRYLATLANEGERAELEQRHEDDAARRLADEQAEVERLAYVFLAAGCEAQGDPFTREEWNAMQPVDKRAVLAGIRAVLVDVRGAVEDD